MTEISTINYSEKEFQFLSGDNEMSRLMRAKDWSESLIGTPDTWPQSLRTTLGILLNSKFPMFLFWGPDLICFYNDAYRPSLGKVGKHPDILGSRGEDYWQEIWAVIKPLIDQVLTGGEATWSEDQLIPIYRNGNLEDVYWTFSYSPVHDETGKPAGVFVTCNETTDKVNTLKKLEESNNRYLNNIIQAPAAMCVFRGKNYIVETVNELMLEIWGKTADQVINKPIFEGLPEVKGQGIESLLDNVYTTGEKFVANERPVNLPRNGRIETTFINFVYEALKEPDGTISGIVAIAFDVTQQVLLRKIVEENEQRLRSFVENAPFPIGVYTGKEMRIQFANQAIVDVWGKQMDVIRKKFAEVLPELAGTGIYEQLNEVFTTGVPFHAHNQRVDLLFHNELKPHYFNYSFTPLFDGSGSIYGVMNTAAEVTDLVVAKQKVEESGNKLNIVIEASELGTWEVNLKTDEESYSDRCLEILGQKERKTLKHEELLKQLHTEDLPITENAMKQAFITGTLHYESRIIWPDQSVHWVESMGKVFYDDQNNPAKMVGTVRDITQEKSYQQELQQREQKFRLLADSMPQHIWTSDTEGNLNYFNKSVFDYSGLTEEQINKDGWIQIVHPDDREENIKVWMNAVSTGKDFLFEHRFRRHDGEYRWQLSRAIPQRDSSGNIQMWVGTSTDIQQIKELDQQKDFFIGMASHELKTPITSIKGYVQILKSIPLQGNDIFLKNSLDIIDKQIVVLTNLISDMLDLSKIKSGGLSLNKEKFQINELINDVSIEITHIHPQCRIVFSKNTDAFVFADRNRIGQVLSNFLTNAVKYSPESEEIQITSNVKDSSVFVSVKDSGIGIGENDQAKIFERFYRVEGKNEKTFPGFGIGLFIAADIIRRHEGQIGVESELGKGACFYFSLPSVTQ